MLSQRMMSLARRLQAGVCVSAVVGVALVVPATPASAATGADLCAQVALTAGFHGESLVTAVAVALAESGCNPAAANASGAIGLWQIHAPSHPAYSTTCLYDAQCNANAAFAISGGGTSWSAWTVYTTGSYQSKVPAARSAVAKIGGTSVLPAGSRLVPGDYLTSPSGGVRLVMQTDGNVVLYQGSSTVLFATGTFVPGASLSLGVDGNLVIYTSAGQPIWATMVFAGAAARLAVQDDGNLVVYAASGTPVWATAAGSLPNAGAGPPPSRTRDDVLATDEVLYTWSPALSPPGGRCLLLMQIDGNLVLYGPAGPLWSTRSVGAVGTYLTVRPDGNVVLYDSKGVRWATGTGGSPGAHLVMQTDCNLVVYSTANVPLWATYTVR